MRWVYWNCGVCGNRYPEHSEAWHMRGYCLPCFAQRFAPDMLREIPLHQCVGCGGAWPALVRDELCSECVRAEWRAEWESRGAVLCAHCRRVVKRRHKYCSDLCMNTHRKLLHRRIRSTRRGWHTSAQWRALVAAYGGRCAYCRVNPGTERDHIVPVTRGGTHSIKNILPCCRTCNASKSDALLVDWVAGRGAVKVQRLAICARSSLRPVP